MEKQKKKHARSRSFTGGGLASFLKSTVAFFSFTFPSASGGTRSSFNHRNGFSGPIVSIVPPEVRGGGGRTRSGYMTPEPSSPKVSCIGQIKRSNSRRQRKVNPCGKNGGGACPLPPAPAEGKPRGSLVKRLSFFRRGRSRTRSRADGLVGNGKESDDGATSTAAAPAPAGLGQMRRFTSGRAAFQDLDWRQEWRRAGRVSDEEDEGFVAHSAPLVLGDGVVASVPTKEGCEPVDCGGAAAHGASSHPTSDSLG
jgi:hypothetical protein